MALHIQYPQVDMSLVNTSIASQNVADGGGAGTQKFVQS